MNLSLSVSPGNQMRTQMSKIRVADVNVIYIVIRIQCFGVSQLFGVGRHASRFAMGLKP